MAYIDPWAAFNSSNASLNKSLDDFATQSRQQAKDDATMSAARQQLALGKIQLDEAQRKQGVMKSVRKQLAAMPDNVTQQVIPGSDVGPPVPVPNPDYNPQVSANRAALSKDIGTARDNAAVYPALAQLMGLNDRIGGMQQDLAALPPDTPQYLPGEPLKPVMQEVRTPVTHEQRLQKMAELYDGAGMLDEAEKVRSGQEKSLNFDNLLAQQKAKIIAGGGDLQQYYNTKQSMNDLKEVMTDVANPKIPLSVREAALNLYKKNHPGQIDDAKLDDFSMQGMNGVFNKVDPQSGQVIGRMIFNPSKGELEFHANTAADTAHNVQEITSPDGRSAQKYQFNPTTQLYDRPLGPAYVVKSQVPNVNVNAVPRESMIGVTGTGEAVYKNSKGGAPFTYDAGGQAPYAGKIFQRSQALGLGGDTPDAGGVTPQNRATNFVLQKNPKIQNAAGNAAMLPELIRDVKESGKSLGYSDLSPLGKSQQYLDKMTNDPRYINYSAKRNDIIMRIGGVMRENGMTDQAQKLEEDSAPRYMSPPAFDAWSEAQMSVLRPIIDKYTSQAQGKGTPLGGQATPAVPGTPISVGKYKVVVH